MNARISLLKRQRKCLAQGWPGTNSKRQSQYPANAPTHIREANGCYIWDHDLVDFNDAKNILFDNTLKELFQTTAEKTTYIELPKYMNKLFIKNN